MQPFTERQIALVETFADQAVIAIENTRLFEAEQASKREFQESLEYQTGVSDVLSVISRSKFELQPVIDTIVETATRLCEAERGAFLRFEEEGFRLVPTTGSVPGPISSGMLGRLIPFDRGSIAGRVALKGSTVHVHDMQADPEITLMRDTVGDTRRTALGVPLLGVSGPIGAIVLQRTVVKPFTDRQIKLVETFADQAVIAIENTRLFNETQEALERQTATANILRVISSSPADIKPVFEAILDNAFRLCNSQVAAAFRFDGTLLHLVATKNWSPEAMATVASRWPMPPDPHMTSGRVVLAKGVVLQEDTLADPTYDHSTAHAGGWRRMIGVPMLRGGDVIGVIVVTWREPGPIPQRQVELLKTFADQAVIAIENTRLFEEVQARTRELTESLEYQTAISEVLAVISRTPNELQPILDTIAETAGRLCEADYTLVFKLVDGLYGLAASSKADAALVQWMNAHPIAPTRGSTLGRTAIEKRTIHLPDVLADPEFTTFDRQRVARAHHTWCSSCARRGRNRGHRVGSQGSTPLHQEANRARGDFRQPGDDRHREHAAVRG